MTDTPEANAYQNALRTWEAYHARSTELNLGDCLRDLDTTSLGQIAEALRVIPSSERGPVAFGVFVKAAASWRPIEQTVFLGEFLSSPSKPERRILEAATRGAMKTSDRLPVTIEEFPSRIWKRAIASGSPARLVSAGHQAVLAMIRLYFANENQGAPTPPDFRKLKLGEEMEFQVPSGDLPPVMDLLGLPPSTLPEMKRRVLDKISHGMSNGTFELSQGQDVAFPAWVSADSCESSDHISVVLRQMDTTLEKLGSKSSLHGRHHTRRLGRLLFRLGLRRDSMRCAKAIGISPWEQGWQFQSIRGSSHTRIREHLIHAGMDTDAWAAEPALACSAMSSPLWLMTPLNRVNDLMRLFQKSSQCPWLFPRLGHVFQWHLALIGKQDALLEIGSIAPDWSVGLADENPSRQYPSPRPKPIPH